MLAAAAVMIMLLTAVTGYAFGDVEFLSVKTLDYEGLYSVITDTEGAEHRLSGVIDADRLEESAAFPKIGSYKIYFGDEEVIEVRLNNIKQTESKGDNRLPLLTSSGASLSAGGYYSVEFRLNDTTEYAFITGLTENNVENVQKELLKSKLENSKFSITDANFIDTEKLKFGKAQDDNLCWAASTADMLEYSGWAKKAAEVNPEVSDKFLNEDTIFDLFVSNFNDNGGNQYYGLQWFFNGYYAVQKATGQNWSTVNNYGESGGFLKDYAYSGVTSAVNVEKHEDILETLSALKDGNAVGVSVSWMKNGAGNGGHAITMWGYIYDKTEPSDSFDYMKALIVTDSDSDRTQNSDRTQAPNKMHILNMKKYNRSGYDTWEFDGYGGDTNVGVLVGFTLLKPYNENVLYEKDTAATRDMINNCDFYISTVSVNGSDEKSITSDKAEKLAVIPTIDNGAGKDYTGELSYSVMAVNKSTGVVADSKNLNTITVEATNSGYSYSYSYYYLPLPKGKYAVTVILDPEKTIPEAYYYNNTYSFDLTVYEVPIELTDNGGTAKDNKFSDSITVKNVSSSALAFTPILALYTNDNRLIGIQTLDEKNLSVEAEETYNFEIVCGGKIPGDAKHKIYLWKSGMIPVEYKILNKTE